MATNEVELKRRRVALAVFSGMIVLWIGLSALSFLGDRPRPNPATIAFRGQTAVEGKRVFQGYNCMGCHTIVGNGAYFGPDLTFTYQETGPAWLVAFLSSSGSWPTEALLELQIDRLRREGALEADIQTLQDYYEKYPGARERVEARGGRETLMPNLPFKPEEIDALIAFLQYTSRLDTEGWPPEVLAPRPRPTPVPAAAAPTPAPGPQTRTSEELGKTLAGQLGCLGCHSTDGTRKVGPTWKGLYGRKRELQDGTLVVADEAYLRESILDPNAKVVKGFPAGVMPAYEGRLSPEELEALIAYLKSLK